MTRPSALAALAALLAVTLLLLPLAYVLSAGPAAYLADIGLLDLETYVSLYDPLWQARKQSSHFRDFHDWYVALWQRPTPPLPPGACGPYGSGAP